MVIDISILSCKHVKRFFFTMYNSVIKDSFHSVAMDKDRRLLIYNRVQQEFNVSQFHKNYYCAGINYFDIQDKLRAKYNNCTLYFRADHIVVKTFQGDIIVYLLTAHSTGRCADFLHD